MIILRTCGSIKIENDCEHALKIYSNKIFLTVISCEIDSDITFRNSLVRENIVLLLVTGNHDVPYFVAPCSADFTGCVLKLGMSGPAGL